jgi:hypothetical protein
MARKDKDECGCLHFHNEKGHERVTLCVEHQAETNARHDAFVADMRARTARILLEEQFT